jgi:large subunit ribosomal protein L13
MSKDLITIDAAGKSLGRIASQVAGLLRGKGSPDFQPNIISSQRVVITNAAQVRVTGKKLLQRTTERYSGYPSGLKKIPYQRTFKKSPSEFIKNAVSGMIPRNRLKKEILKHLTIYDTGQEK